MKLDYKYWITTALTIITLVAGASVAYGQITTKIDTLEQKATAAEVLRKDTVEKYEKTIQQTNDKIQTIQLEQTEMKTMMRLLLQNQGITPPAPTPVPTPSQN